MIEYHVFWVLYALASLFGYHEYNAHDCNVIAQNIHVETKYEGATCFKKESDSWVILK